MYVWTWAKTSSVTKNIFLILLKFSLSLTTTRSNKAQTRCFISFWCCSRLCQHCGDTKQNEMNTQNTKSCVTWFVHYFCWIFRRHLGVLAIEKLRIEQQYTITKMRINETKKLVDLIQRESKNGGSYVTFSLPLIQSFSGNHEKQHFQSLENYIWASRPRVNDPVVVLTIADLLAKVLWPNSIVWQSERPREVVVFSHFDRCDVVESMHDTRSSDWAALRPVATLYMM